MCFKVGMETSESTRAAGKARSASPTHRWKLSQGAAAAINQPRMGQGGWNCHAPDTGGSVAVLKQNIQPPPLGPIRTGCMKRLHRRKIENISSSCIDHTTGFLLLPSTSCATLGKVLQASGPVCYK
uniref:Uncharacterized protein n=1 Tax=Pipistrellus kuhlii TaxID=59472 RepID=A0A7J7YXE4_PIPKU|nr:hypothetical protein mPipKuh1_009920 [Pipistrellus kuhlii]